MRHGEVKVDPPSRSERDQMTIWSGLTMPIDLYRYLYPCRCSGGLCKCEAGS